MDDDDFVTDIKAMLLEEAEPPISISCCIYRVPFHIRRLNEDAYTPKFVSIGPFHHGHAPLQYMEQYKRIFCKTFLHRSQASLDSLLSCIQNKIEADFRRFYSDTLGLSKKELVKMILVDSCFIFELFLRYHRIHELPVNDAFLLTHGVATNIKTDLLLLENQLPFNFLDHLYNLSFSFAVGSREIPKFIELTRLYFGNYNRSNYDYQNIYIEHFTDLIRTFHLQHPPGRRPGRQFEQVEHLLSATELVEAAGRRPGRQFEQVEHLLSATELVEAGVRFEVNNETSCLLDLKFSRRVLKIPQLTLDDETEILFFNMVAWEQCRYPHEAYITGYTVVWDFLLNTGRDVDVLVRNGILVNWLGDSDSVATLFNGAWKNITGLHFNDDYLRLCRDLNAYCKDPRNKMKATLRRDYCSTPLQTSEIIFTGIVVVLLTLIQTVCSVLQALQGSPKQ